MKLEPIDLSKRQIKILGLSWILTGIMFGCFFLFGVMGAKADDYTTDINYTQKANSSGYGVAWYNDSQYNANRMEYVAGLTGYLREVKYSCLYYPNDRLYHFEIRSISNSLLYRSTDYHTNTCGYFTGHTDDNIKTVSIAQFDNLYFEAGDHFYFGFVVDDIGSGCDNGNGLQPSCLITGLNATSIYTYDHCISGNVTCSSTASSYGIWLNTKVDTVTQAPLPIPELISPTLPYVSSSTPIRITVLNPEAGRVVCVNTENSWRQSSGVGIENSYFTFAVDMEEGTNSIRCHAEQGTRISGYLDFDLTFTPGSLEAPTPIFVETANGFTYSYNPARVQVKAVIAGDIWCKRGSSAFFNAGSVLADGSVYFDLDFTDVGTLVDGIEYTVSCYLETQEGNSSTVQQVYTYHSGSICEPDFGTGTGDVGFIINTVRGVYTAISNLPILGDLIYLDCVIYNDFYSNLVPMETENLTYHITAFNVDEDVSIPLTGLKSSMTSWASGSGYSGIKTTVTTLLWIALMFGLFFKFVFPMIWTSTHPDQSVGLNKTISEVEDKLEDDMFK